MARWVVEDPPYIKRNVHATIDYIGFALLAVWLATMQIVLDKGQEADWFGTLWVRWGGYSLFHIPCLCSLLHFFTSSLIHWFTAFLHSSLFTRHLLTAHCPT